MTVSYKENQKLTAMNEKEKLYRTIRYLLVIITILVIIGMLWGLISTILINKGLL